MIAAAHYAHTCPDWVVAVVVPILFALAIGLPALLLPKGK